MPANRIVCVLCVKENRFARMERDFKWLCKEVRVAFSFFLLFICIFHMYHPMGLILFNSSTIQLIRWRLSYNGHTPCLCRFCLCLFVRLLCS